MKLPTTALRLDTLNLQRFLRRSFVEQGVRALKIALLVGVVLIVLALAWDIYRNSQQIDEEVNKFDARLKESLAMVQAGTQAADSKRNFAVIGQRSPFGPIGVSTPAAKAVPSKPLSVTPLNLIGTFLSKGQPAFAIIEEKKKNTQEVFNLNDTVFGEAKLTGIYSDRVEILRNGSTEVLMIDTAAEAGPPDSGVSSGGGDDFVVAEAELDKALENLPLLLTQARAVPFFKEGRAVGLRLFAIRSGSLFEKIGLQNGDILKSVNGSSLADLSQAMQLFQKLKEERSISLSLERNNGERQFRYQIR